ncbi:MAG: spermidine synthase [Opitutaceae bacterium]|mgnify:FL=1|jgi:spermidine synthase|nr:spermidine synthase [Opitutaceae bacterium]
MPANFEEIDYQETPLGPVSLRRQRLKMLDDREIHEVKLGNDYLMSSLFTKVEEELARLGLAATPGDSLDVVVGGLGLGYTAMTALKDPRIASLIVVDYLQPVIDWHQRGLVPLGPKLMADKRCRFVHGDFFALAAADGMGFDPDQPQRQFDAVLLDIDHSPDHLLHPRHAHYYSAEGLRTFSRLIRPGGVFGLWSDDPPEERFLANLKAVFADVQTEVVAFPNPFLHRDSESTVYVCRLAE